MRIRLVFLIAPLAIAVFPSFSGAERAKYAVGVNYPGLSFRYAVSGKTGIEAKLQSETDILVLGLRGYRYLAQGKISPFWGLALDRATFKGAASEGAGMVVEGFAGGEYFIGDWLSLQLDFGPAMIMLTDKNSGVTDAGLEFVFNLGFNWYFGGRP